MSRHFPKISFKKIPPSPKLDDMILKTNQILRMIHADTEKHACTLEEMKHQDELAFAENPIKSLRERKGCKIKRFADILSAPYRTVQDWNFGKSQLPHLDGCTTKFFIGEILL